MAKLWIFIAGLLGAGAVAIGALHAHGLQELLESRFDLARDEAESVQKDNRLFRERFDADENGRLDGEEIDDYIADLMHNCQTAVTYQVYHALAILGVGILLTRSRGFGWFLLNCAALVMLLGVVGFSGGLYCMVFDLARLHWAVIPAGGMLMIVGWLVLAVAGIFASTGAAPAEQK